MNRERLKQLLAEHGRVAIWTYFTIFALVFAGFAIAIAWGVEVESASGSAGVLGAAYAATKLTQIFRIAATFALTPVVARVVRRFNGGGAPEASARATAPESAPPGELDSSETRS